MLVHAGKYRTEDKLKTHTHTTKAKHNPEKANKTKYHRTKLACLVASHDTWPGNEVGLFYNAPEPTRGHRHSELLIHVQQWHVVSSWAQVQ